MSNGGPASTLTEGSSNEVGIVYPGEPDKSFGCEDTPGRETFPGLQEGTTHKVAPGTVTGRSLYPLGADWPGRGTS